jgi:hypothetical protein
MDVPLLTGATSSSPNGSTFYHARGRWNPCCHCPFSALPDDLIEKVIFPFLDRASLASCAQTCTRFCYLSESSDLWRQVNASATPASGVGLARLLARHAGHVNELRLKLGIDAEASAPSECEVTSSSSGEFGEPSRPEPHSASPPRLGPRAHMAWTQRAFAPAERSCRRRRGWWARRSIRFIAEGA